MNKKSKNILLTATALSLFLSMGTMAYAQPNESDMISRDQILKSATYIMIQTDRTSSTRVSLSATGQLLAKADSIKTVAELYEYYPATGTLSSSAVSSKTSTSYNCYSYSYSTSFSLNASKQYKVKLTVTDTTAGKVSKSICYSSSF